MFTESYCIQILPIRVYPEFVQQKSQWQHEACLVFRKAQSLLKLHFNFLLLPGVMNTWETFTQKKG